ncbi:tyrosine-type recombinase/integrase [Solibacillus sp. FSL H8-0538]|uniref:tyrosine-type recombinase/integrase n=1 Tax=Solibacillus sp. FSL H8-0538 TaxID=2921400 RepID=UPI0030F6C662
MSLTIKYLQHLQLEGKSLNTLDTYRYHLIAFFTWVKENGHELDGLRPAHLFDFKEVLLKEGKSERTVNGIISCVRGYFDYLVLNEVVKMNPVSKLLQIKVADYRQDRLTDEQLNHFYHFIDALQVNVRAAFYLMLATGARVSEIADLTKVDFSIENDKLFVDIPDANWGSVRKVPVLNVKAAQILVDYLADLEVTDLPAFRVSKRTLQRYAYIFSEQYGIQFSCHALRHTFATILLENGVQIEKIQYLLGHRSITLARQYKQPAFMNVNDLDPSVWVQT